MVAISAPKLSLLSLLATLVGAVSAFDDVDEFGFVYSNPALRNRPNLNTKLKPSVPIVSAPAGFAVQRADGRQLPPYDTIYEFDQLIDHKNPSLGTYKQRYMFTYEWYEKGGPITFTTPGEANAAPYSGYLTNRTIAGRIAQEHHGASIVLEHRFFGLSNPYPDLTEKSLAVHTLENAIDDLVYFANNVKLPFPDDLEDGSQVGPDKLPWILIGGSYSGALTSWTMVARPGVFHAGWSSSGVVEAITNYWGYFEPIRQNMPANCSADVQQVIEYIDSKGIYGTESEKQLLKSKFGMPNVTHYDDFASTLRNQLWAWQSISPAGGREEFNDFCNALEVKDGVAAEPSGWGLEHTLDTWGAYETQWVAAFCPGPGSQDDCVGTYDPTLAYYRNTTVDQVWRSWYWLCCNSVGYFQVGAPLGWPTTVSRLVTPAYDGRPCSYYFPESFPNPAIPQDVETNLKYGGWDVNLDRVYFVNGKNDPWREATVSSDFHPRKSTERQPIFVAEGGFHCSDLQTRNAADPSINEAQLKGLAYMAAWLTEFVPKDGAVVQSSTDAAPLPPPPADFVPSVSIPDQIVNAPAPTVDLGVVNSGAPPPPTGGLKEVDHVVIPNAWARPPIEVEW